MIDWNEVTRFRAKVEMLQESRAFRSHPDTLIANIGIGKQQLVEIAKALAKEVQNSHSR